MSESRIQITLIWRLLVWILSGSIAVVRRIGLRRALDSQTD